MWSIFCHCYLCPLNPFLNSLSFVSSNVGCWWRRRAQVWPFRLWMAIICLDVSWISHCWMEIIRLLISPLNVGNSKLGNIIIKVTIGSPIIVGEVGLWVTSILAVHCPQWSHKSGCPRSPRECLCASLEASYHWILPPAENASSGRLLVTFASASVWGPPHTDPLPGVFSDSRPAFCTGSHSAWLNSSSLSVGSRSGQMIHTHLFYLQ